MNPKRLIKASIHHIDKFCASFCETNASLLFHRVAPNSEYSDPESLCISPNAFEQLLYQLNHSHDFLRLEDFLSGKPGIHITFDDGYLDNYTYALPILLKLNCPATFFVTTSFIQSRVPWWDLLWEHVSITTSSESALLEYENLRNVTRDRFMSCPTEMSTLLASAFPPGVSLDNPPFMTPTHISELSQLPGITIGNHSHAHQLSSSLSPSAFHLDLALSTSLLTSWTSKKPCIYAYPYGHRHSWNRHNIQSLHSLGYTHAFSNIPGYHTQYSRPYSIRRYLISSRYPLDLDHLLSIV